MKIGIQIRVCHQGIKKQIVIYINHETYSTCPFLVGLIYKKPFYSRYNKNEMVVSIL